MVADDELAGSTNELAQRLAKGSTGSFAATKRLLNESAFAGFKEQLDREADEQQMRARSADFIEGVMAFAETREPNFSGD